MTKKLTYAQSGVDIQKEESAIQNLIKKTIFTRQGLGKPLGGHYAGLIDFGNYALVLCTDGVGSKVLIANAIKKWDTIGIDCIAMNVNDAICVGAEPLAFVDYLAIDDPNPQITQEIGKGLNTGAEQANMSIIGGETASLPDIINGFDLAGTCLAYVQKNNIITGEHIQPGHDIIGLASTGIHSNGYSLVRKCLKEKNLSYLDPYPHNTKQTIGEVLLTPTRIYVKEILALIKQIPVTGLAHITGGGLRNLYRLKSTVHYQIDNPITPPTLYDFIQQTGNIEPQEMYQTFNMGMGFCIILPKEHTKKAISLLQKNTTYTVQHVGKITQGSGVSVPSMNIHFDTTQK